MSDSANRQIERQEVRVFSAVVEEGGFSRAAERLHLSQSAVSQTIANLEHKLDARLILRGRTPELTEAGKRLFTYAQTVIHEEMQTLADIEQIRSGALSTLSLAMNSTVNRVFGKSLMLEFCEQNPLTRLQLDVAPGAAIVKGVDEDRWELGFGPFHTTMPGHFEMKELFTEQRRLVVHRNNPALNAILQNPADALKQTVLLTSFLPETPRHAGGDRIRDRFAGVWEVSNLGLQTALAEAGKGVLYLSDRLLEEMPDFVPVSGVDIADIGRRVGVYYKKHRALSEGARRFVVLCERRF